MNQMSKLRWALIATSLLSGSALAATINCEVTPKNSVIADGQTLQLAATCTGGSLSSIDLLMNDTSVSGSVSLSDHVSGEAVYFTTPVGLAVSGAMFKVVGTPADGLDTFGSSTEAKVVVKSSSGAAVAATSGFTSTSADPAACGTANNTTVSSLPSNGALCQTGSKPALVVSAPTSYSWSCISLTGGAEANCYATRGVTYTVTTSVSGGNGTISSSQQVTGGNSATVTASPATNYNTSWSGSCGGTPSGNSYTTNAVNANCTVVASFSTAPAAVNGSCGSSNGGTFSTAPATNLCSAGTSSSVATNTSTYTWSCNGSNGGTNASCSATKTTTPPPTGGNDPGSGSWWPASNRLIADQTGTSTSKLSYVPGCLNGESASSGSNGCALNSTYDGFSFGPGNVLGVRYQSKSTVSTSPKYIKVNSAYGGAVSSSLNAWLSSNPASTFESTTTGCKGVYSAGNIYVITGSSYCQIQPNTRYYLFINDETGTETRYILDETSADFQ